MTSLSLIKIIGLSVAAGGAAWLSVQPAAAQQAPTNSRVIPMEGAAYCPPDWDEGNGTSNRPALKHCYPRRSGESKMAYRKKAAPCISGYGIMGSDYWCVQGYVTEPQLARANAFEKRDVRDRCPAGFHSYKMVCSSDYAKTATYRWKGAAECKAGEIAEWGIWCTSNFEHLTAIQISSAANRDWNNIYTATNGQEPKQSPDSPYSEVYIHMFGAPAANKSSSAAGGAPEQGSDAAAAKTAECAVVDAATRGLGGLAGKARKAIKKGC